MQEECKNAPKKSVVPERDFGMLDHLLAQEPIATILVFEGILMFAKNDSRSWRHSLSPEKKASVIEMARNSRSSQERSLLSGKQ